MSKVQVGNDTYFGALKCLRIEEKQVVIKKIATGIEKIPRGIYSKLKGIKKIPIEIEEKPRRF